MNRCITSYSYERPTLISFVWNNFDSDDRVQKKMKTLSKYFNCIVYSVPKPKDYKRPYRKVTDNICVKYIPTLNMIDWVFKRIIVNEWFWKKHINPKHFKSYLILIDCNDPDTLSAANYIKSKNNKIKVIYDAHEYHKDNIVPYPGIFGYYSKVASKLHHYREKKYINIINKMIVVSNSIKKLVEKDKLTNAKIYTIPNLSNKYKDIDITKKEKIATFVGGHSRPGLEKVINKIQDLGYKVYQIGNKPKKEIKGVTYLGHIPKKKYMQFLEKSEIGLLYYDAPNLSFKNSYPNKLSDYIQTKNIVITNKDLKNIANIVEKYKVGISINDNTLKSVLNKKLIHLKNNYELDLNFYVARNDLCWESQETQLLDIYKPNGLDS